MQLVVEQMETAMRLNATLGLHSCGLYGRAGECPAGLTFCRGQHTSNAPAWGLRLTVVPCACRASLLLTAVQDKPQIVGVWP